MRLIPTLLFLLLISSLPSLCLHIKFRRNFKNALAPFIIWAMPVLFFVTFMAFNLVRHYSNANTSSVFAEWFLLLFVTIFLPPFVFTLFYLIDKCISVLFRHGFKFFRYIGAILGVIIVAVMICGAAMRHHIQVREISITSENLPEAFDGMRIVQITDLHLGNLTPEKPYLNKIVSNIEDLHPDLLLFTGDILNISVADGIGNEGLFSEINTRYGRYAVMGNHDYGDYMKWESEADYQHNIELTYEFYRNVGFTLLNDSSLYLYNGNDSIGLIGVENWGVPPFPQYGSLADATLNFTPAPFNILMSHDPTHWEAEIIPDYRYIDLTLAGHTHSAQMGIDAFGVKYSPSKWIFKHWDGLYSNTSGDGKTQYLNISRGLGYVGIPFRLGMPAEITVITLRSTKR